MLQSSSANKQRMEQKSSNVPVQQSPIQEPIDLSLKHKPKKQQHLSHSSSFEEQVQQQSHIVFDGSLR